jgi:hypothetical protein
MGRVKAKKPRRERPVDLGEVSEEHVEASAGWMVTAVDQEQASAADMHANLQNGPGGFANYERMTGDQWQVTVMVVGRPSEDAVRCTEIPTLEEAFDIARDMAATLLPSGAALLHCLDGSADAWIPTYLAAYGHLPAAGGWTAVADAGGTTADRSRSYISAARS